MATDHVWHGCPTGSEATGEVRVKSLSQHAYRSARRCAARERANQRIKQLETENTSIKEQLQAWESWWSAPRPSEGSMAPVTPMKNAHEAHGEISSSLLFLLQTLRAENGLGAT